MEAAPDRRWTEAAIAAEGLDPSTVRRAFQRHCAMSFPDYARHSRLRERVRAFATGAPVIAAQHDAGFDSASGFRAAFARLFGHAPAQMTRGQPGLVADWLDTPLGGMIAVTDDRALHLLEFSDRKALATELQRLSKAVRGQLGLGRTAITDAAEAQLARYFAAQSGAFDLPLVLHGTPFLRQVWTELQRIPPGATVSYGQLAARIGRPTASRAVARANGANQIASVIPCHRVIGADGSLTGYAGGVWRKQALIDIERRLAANGAG